MPVASNCLRGANVGLILPVLQGKSQEHVFAHDAKSGILRSRQVAA